MLKEKFQQEKVLSFENSLKELEEIVSRLEPGILPLEEALHEFERGIKIAKQAQKVLKQAEQRVQILLSDDKNQELNVFLPNNE